MKGDSKMCEEIKAKAELMRRIITAYHEGGNAGVEDPAQVILQTIQAQRKVKIFWELLSEQLN
jgi:hypothetical protein